MGAVRGTEAVRHTETQEKWVQVDFFSYVENSTKKSMPTFFSAKLKLDISPKY